MPGEDDLRLVQRHFHKLIRDRNGDTEEDGKLEERGFIFPDLEKHWAEHKEEAVYYGVPGMYGGFNASLSQTPKGWILKTDSWIRVCGGSEQSHEITGKGTKMTAGHEN